ncbi:hypothetical protein EDB81DRAFT_760497 [Dactylonectria macrodidyma]|uniref:Uncharacterized protein n=1 Tax=Dactylonectria macrodidyma TaxID=307937 RepID=A0A9P9J177_9HYPO|nr:hypothetical protein EDB81DRAFT_760497 [Dactylonectria macrodidyma]
MALSRALSAMKQLASLGERLVSARKREDGPSRNVSRFFNHYHLVSQTCWHLSDVDRAALALSCRRALSTVGRGVLRLHAEDKFLLLQRLERDGYLMEEGEMLCPVCQYFHLPLDLARFSPGEEPSHFEGQRACLSRRTERMQAMGYGDMAPLRFDMVAAILRSHRHKSSFYRPRMLFTIQSYSTGSEVTGKIVVRVLARVVHDQLIVESNIRLCQRDPNVLVPLLKEFLENNHQLMHICEHHEWQHVLGEHEPDADLDVRTRFAHDCALRKENETRRGIASPNDGTTRRNKGTLCDDCCTAFIISCCHALGRVFRISLTTWKNYGYGRDMDDPMWLSHTNTIAGHDARRYVPEVSAFEGTHFALRAGYCPSQWMREPKRKRRMLLTSYHIAKHYSKKRFA